MAASLSANVRNRRKGRDNHTDREGPQTTDCVEKVVEYSMATRFA
jgi:hypothetical protein